MTIRVPGAVPAFVVVAVVVAADEVVAALVVVAAAEVVAATEAALVVVPVGACVPMSKSRFFLSKPFDLCLRSTKNKPLF